MRGHPCHRQLIRSASLSQDLALGLGPPHYASLAGTTTRFKNWILDNETEEAASAQTLHEKKGIPCNTGSQPCLYSARCSRVQLLTWTLQHCS